jgi:predicted neuraminidase
MFVFDKAPFPSCHASTVVETRPGRLLAAWFGGTGEGARDVQIWASAFDGTKWEPPAVLAAEPGQPCWNPVLFLTARGTLRLWYKAGPGPTNWTGYARSSADGGGTWSKPEVLPAGFYGPVRAKPIQLNDGTLLAGTSVESGERATSVWTPYVDRSADDGVAWTRSTPFNLPGQHGQIQPTLFAAADGRIVALTRSRQKWVCRAESRDGGRTFTPSVPTALPNPSSGIDAVKTRDGDVFLVYNPVAIGRFPLSLARSTDDGATWTRVADLESAPGEFSYPAMIPTADGKLAVTYTWNRTHIKYEVIDPGKYR